jgi:hypothetical protein
MLARLDLLLPFTITIPEGENFSIYQYNDEGYNIRIFPPIKIEHLVAQDDLDEILINGKPALQAKGLSIYFQKDNFDRRQGSECDPPYPLIARTINQFLLKLRFVTRGSKIRPINFPYTSWHLQYLNDDESELDKTEGLVKGRGTKTIAFSWTALNNDVWEKIIELPPDYIPPQWDTLPEIGPSVVLAETALEVFISHILNELSKNSSIPKDLWDWINDRNGRLNEPTNKEQFDILLKTLLGISLKENNDLWESFTKLKKARNSFVHEGIPKIGQNPISEGEARELLVKANEIVIFIKNELPEDLRWPEYKHSIKVEAKKKVF